MKKGMDFIVRYKFRLLIIFCSMIFLCCWISRKEGYHVDEIISYEMANAEFSPWIVPTQPEGRLAKLLRENVTGESLSEKLSQIVYLVKDTLQNRGTGILAQCTADVYDAPVWIDRDTYRSYMRSDYGGAFNVLSAYFNSRSDNHPPLFYIALNLMCSIFPGEVSPWQGGLLNMTVMLLVLWLVGRIGDFVLRKESTKLAAMICFGFSIGIVASTLWIRMYALLTLWLTWLIFIHMKKWKSGSFHRISPKSRKVKLFSNGSIILLTVLAYWTQYFALLLILPMAAVTMAALWNHKRIQDLKAYFRSMLLAAVIGIAGYPFSIKEILFSGRGTEAITKLGSGLTDWGSRILTFGGVLCDNLLAGSIIGILLIALPLLFLMIWKGQSYSKIKNNSQDGQKIRTSGKEKWNDNTILLCMLGIPGSFYFLAAAKISPYFEPRYIMAVFPLTILLLFWLWELALGRLTNRRTSVYGLGISLLCITMVVIPLLETKGNHPFLFTGYAAQLEVAKNYQNYPMICFYPGASYYENVIEMEYYKKTLLIQDSDLPYMEEERISQAKDGYILLIKYPSEDAGRVQLTKIKEVFGGSQERLLFDNSCHGDIIYLVTP